jgi:hypothetical protein
MEDLKPLLSCWGNYMYKTENSYTVPLRFSKRSIDFFHVSLSANQHGQNRSTNSSQTVYGRRTLNLVQKSSLSFNLVDWKILNKHLHLICIFFFIILDSVAKKSELFVYVCLMDGYMNLVISYRRRVIFLVSWSVSRQLCVTLNNATNTLGLTYETTLCNTIQDMRLARA